MTSLRHWHPLFIISMRDELPYFGNIHATFRINSFVHKWHDSTDIHQNLRTLRPKHPQCVCVCHVIHKNTGYRTCIYIHFYDVEYYRFVYLFSLIVLSGTDEEHCFFFSLVSHLDWLASVPSVYIPFSCYSGRRRERERKRKGYSDLAAMTTWTRIYLSTVVPIAKGYAVRAAYKEKLDFLCRQQLFQLLLMCLRLEMDWGFGCMFSSTYSVCFTLLFFFFALLRCVSPYFILAGNTEHIYHHIGHSDIYNLHTIKVQRTVRSAWVSELKLYSYTVRCARCDRLYAYNKIFWWAHSHEHSHLMSFFPIVNAHSTSNEHAEYFFSFFWLVMFVWKLNNIS